jgi:hypothetical protein
MKHSAEESRCSIRKSGRAHLETIRRAPLVIFPRRRCMTFQPRSIDSRVFMTRTREVICAPELVQSSILTWEVWLFGGSCEGQVVELLEIRMREPVRSMRRFPLRLIEGKAYMPIRPFWLFRLVLVENSESSPSI